MDSTTSYVQADGNYVPTPHRQLPQHHLRSREAFSLSSRLHGDVAEKAVGGWPAPAGSSSVAESSCSDAAASFPAPHPLPSASQLAVSSSPYGSYSTSVQQRSSNSKGTRKSSGDNVEGDCVWAVAEGSASVATPSQHVGGGFVSTVSPATFGPTFSPPGTSTYVQQPLTRMQQLQQQQELCIRRTSQQLMQQQTSAVIRDPSDPIEPLRFCTTFPPLACWMRPPELYQPPIYSAVHKKVIPPSLVTCAAATGAAAGDPLQQPVLTLQTSPPALPPPGAVYRAALCSAALLRPRRKRGTNPAAAAAATGPGSDGKVSGEARPGKASFLRGKASAGSDSAVTSTASTASCTSFCEEEGSIDAGRGSEEFVRGDRKHAVLQRQQRQHGFYSLQDEEEAHSHISSERSSWCWRHKDCCSRPSLFELSSRGSSTYIPEEHRRLYDQQQQQQKLRLCSRGSEDYGSQVFSCLSVTEKDCSGRSSRLTRSQLDPLEYQHLEPMGRQQQHTSWSHGRSSFSRQQVPLSSVWCWGCRPSLLCALRRRRVFSSVCVAAVAVVLLLVLCLVRRVADVQVEPRTHEQRGQPAVDLQEAAREHPTLLAAALGNPTAAASKKSAGSRHPAAAEDWAAAAATASTTAGTVAAEIAASLAGSKNVLPSAALPVALSALPPQQQQGPSHSMPPRAFESQKAAPLFNFPGGTSVCNDRSYKPNTLRLAHEQPFFSLFSQADGISSYEGSDVTAAGNALYVVFDSSYAIGRTDFSLTPFGHGNRLLYPVDEPGDPESDWEAVTVDALTGYMYAIREVSEHRGSAATSNSAVRSATAADPRAKGAYYRGTREHTVPADVSASASPATAAANPAAIAALTATAAASPAAAGYASRAVAQEEEGMTTDTDAAAAATPAAHGTSERVPPSAAAGPSVIPSRLSDGMAEPRATAAALAADSTKQATPDRSLVPHSVASAAGAAGDKTAPVEEETAANTAGATDPSTSVADDSAEEPPQQLLRKPSANTSTGVAADEFTAPPTRSAEGGPADSFGTATAAGSCCSSRSSEDAPRGVLSAEATGLSEQVAAERPAEAAAGAPEDFLGERAAAAGVPPVEAAAAAKQVSTETAGREPLGPGDAVIFATDTPGPGGVDQARFSSTETAAGDAAGTAARAEDHAWKTTAAKAEDSSNERWWDHLWHKIFPPSTSDGQPAADSRGKEEAEHTAVAAAPAAASGGPASPAATPTGVAAAAGKHRDHKAARKHRKRSRAAAAAAASKRMQPEANRQRREGSTTSTDSAAADSDENEETHVAAIKNSNTTPTGRPLPRVTTREPQEKKRSTSSTTVAATGAVAAKPQPDPEQSGARGGTQADAAAPEQEAAGGGAGDGQSVDRLAGAATTEAPQNSPEEKAELHYHAIVQKIRMQPGGRYLITESCRTEKLFSHNNKGFEGVASFRDRRGTLFLLGLCEGNFCEGGTRGEQRGNGRLVLMKREDAVDPDGTATCIWKTVKVIKLPRDIYFRDYSSMALHGMRIAITSQEDSVVWLGELQNVGEDETVTATGAEGRATGVGAHHAAATGASVDTPNNAARETGASEDASIRETPTAEDPTTARGEAAKDGVVEEHTVDASVDETEVKHCESDTTRQQRAGERLETANTGSEQTVEEAELHRRRGPLLLVDDVTKLEVRPGGRILYFPRDTDCNVIYCNVEGVTFITDTLLAAVSDKVKDYQDHRCIAKEQSLHIFAVPPLRRKQAAISGSET